MVGETNALRVKIQLIEIMKTGPGKIIHFKDMKKVSLFGVIQCKSEVVSHSVYQCSIIFGEFSLNLLWDPRYFKAKIHHVKTAFLFRIKVLQG